MKEFETFLPLFSGFYESYWSDQGDWMNEEFERINEIRNEKGLEPVEFDKIEWDWDKFYKDISISMCDTVSYFIESECGLTNKIIFQETRSPREYNFYSDSINCVIKFSPIQFYRLISKYKERINELINKRYTSRDGFISFYANSLQGWRDDYKCGYLDLGHAIGALLGFMLEIEHITEDMCYDDIAVNLEILNYNQLIGEPDSISNHI